MRHPLSTFKIHAAVLSTLTLALIISKLFDQTVLADVERLRYPILTATLSWITSFQSVIAVLLVVPVLFMWENRRSSWITPLGIAFIASSVVTLLIKALTERRRPYGVSGMFGIWDSSFPSGHTAVSFALATILSSAYPKLRTFWYSFAGLVAIGRIYLEAHYTSDVLAGTIVGLGIGWMTLYGCRRFGNAVLTPQKEFIMTDALNKTTEYATEFRRKLLHMGVGIAIVMLSFFQIITVFDLFVILAIGVALSFAAARYRIPVVYWILDKFERKHTKPGKGAITFMIGAILSLKLFPADIAYASILILSLGDGFSAIIGPLGITKTRLSETKLIEGTLAGIILGTIGASFFVSSFESVLAASSAMIVEATEIKLNNKILSDNILVPLVAGTVIVMLRRFA